MSVTNNKAPLGVFMLLLDKEFACCEKRRIQIRICGRRKGRQLSNNNNNEQTNIAECFYSKLFVIDVGMNDDAKKVEIGWKIT